MSLLIWFSHCLIVLPWRKVGKAKVNYFQATSKLFQISDDHLLTKMFAWVGSSGGSLCFTAGRGVEPKFPHETTKIPALTHFKVNTSRLRCSVIWGELSWVEIWRGERGKAEISSMGPDLYHIKKKKKKGTEIMNHSIQWMQCIWFLWGGGDALINKPRSMSSRKNWAL